MCGGSEALRAWRAPGRLACGCGCRPPCSKRAAAAKVDGRRRQQLNYSSEAITDLLLAGWLAVPRRDSPSPSPAQPSSQSTHLTSIRSISGAPRPCPGSSPNLVRSKPGGSGQAVMF